MPTTVVNIHGRKPQTIGANEVYIGHRVSRGGWRLAESPWANPFGSDYGTLDGRLAAYTRYLRSRPDLMARLGELTGRTLCCWCAPARCHGDILAALADAQRV